MPQQKELAPPTPAEGTDGRRGRRIDLSVTQVAASALAAVVGAVLASELGVYGTILGAAVVSVGATIGGAVFQHVFKRTGEQLRQAVERPEEPDQSQPKPAGELNSDWNEPQLLRAKRRWNWKTYALASGLVFALAMTPVLVVELAAGKPLSAITTGGNGSGTSLNPGGGAKPQPAPPARHDTPSPTVGTNPATVPPAPSATPASPAPTDKRSTHPSPSPTPSGTPSSATPSAPASGTPTTPGDSTPQPTPTDTPTP